MPPHVWSLDLSYNPGISLLKPSKKAYVDEGATPRGADTSEYLNNKSFDSNPSAENDAANASMVVIEQGLDGSEERQDMDRSEDSPMSNKIGNKKYIKSKYNKESRTTAIFPLLSKIIEDQGRDLQKLSLEGCDINDAGVKALVKGLETHDLLSFLNLSKNKIAD
jgi:hypothetical protein